MSADAIEHALEIIDRNASLQSQFIADLLHVSQIVSGKLRLQVQVIDLAPLIEGEIQPDLRHVLGDAMGPMESRTAVNAVAQLNGHVPDLLT